MAEVLLPPFANLPVVEGKPAKSSWGLWGADDRLGCLNLLTPERVLAGVACVSHGAVFALNLDMELPGPPLFHRAAFEHKINSTAASNDDELSNWNTQSSSQWDGFRHVRHLAHGHYNGLPDEDHGMHIWARKGLAGRAVLCDVARWREAVGRPIDYTSSDPIEPEDIASALAAQNTVVETGDILLLRTGWVGWYRGLDEGARTGLAGDLKSPGVRPGLATAEYLWDLHIAAIAADNPALEVWPPGSTLTPEKQEEIRGDMDALPEFFLHFSLLPLLGLPIGELWDLEALAEDCAADGVYTCMFTSAPLNLRQGVASPPNALAIK